MGEGEGGMIWNNGIETCITLSYVKQITKLNAGAPGGSDGKESACNVGDPGLITVLRRSPGEGNGNPLQDSCLENPMDRGD